MPILSMLALVVHWFQRMAGPFPCLDHVNVPVALISNDLVPPLFFVVDYRAGLPFSEPRM
jgi:hypothetical protein